MDPSASPKHQVSAVFLRSIVLYTAAVMAAFALLASTSQASAEPNGPSADVINGTIVPNSPTEWPFIVALLHSAGNGASQYCGGSLIKVDWVLTAAHCVDTASGGSTPGGILYGRKNLVASGGQVLGVSAVYVHPNYNPSMISNDIAMIKLASTPASPSTIITAVAADDPSAGTAVKAAGWGATDPAGNNYPNDLYEASLNTVSNATCSFNWGNGGIFATSLCASTGPSDTCFGDSGGPLIHNTVGGPRLVGIVSWGSSPCAQASLPGVYTRVSSYESLIGGLVSKSISPSAAQLDFGSAAAGTAAVRRTITFVSTGEDPITVGSASITSGSDFSVTGGTCVGGTFASGASCQVEVAFNPAIPGARPGELTLGSNSSGFSNTKVPLRGHTAGQILNDVSLSLRMPNRSKAAKKRGKIKSELLISFPVPSGKFGSETCVGLMRMSLKVPSYRKAFVKGGQVLWGSNGCYAKFVYSLPKRARGKRAKVTMTFDGNTLVRATSQTATQRIR